MANIKTLSKLDEQVIKIKENKSYRNVICRNIKKFRIEYYNEFKNQNGNARGIYNPYSVDNISYLLDMSKVHYKRLESETDINKHISLDNLMILKEIYDKSLDDFLKE